MLSLVHAQSSGLRDFCMSGVSSVRSITSIHTMDDSSMLGKDPSAKYERQLRPQERRRTVRWRTAVEHGGGAYNFLFLNHTESGFVQRLVGPFFPSPVIKKYCVAPKCLLQANSIPEWGQ